MGSIDTSRGDSTIIKSSAPLTGGKRLRELLSDPSNVVVCPGVFDGLTARLALAAGFDAMYMVSNRSMGIMDFLLIRFPDGSWYLNVPFRLG